jgi:hypothetical protein
MNLIAILIPQVGEAGLPAMGRRSQNVNCSDDKTGE